MKAKVEKYDGDKCTKSDIEADAAKLSQLSLTPGCIVRVPTADKPPEGLKFVYPDEGGFRRVGPA